MRCTSCVAASALVAITSAQIVTDCNPMKKTCPNNPAIPKNWDTDFTIGEDAMKGWKQTAGSLTYSSEGAEFIIAQKEDSPTIGSSAYFHYGYVEVVMKAAPGVGIVSAFVLASDDQDEVDWEWIGGVDSRVQLNYYGKGNTTTYDRMTEVPVANNQNAFHSYALNWTSDSLTWIVDGKPTRTLHKADANGGKSYPQTPSNIRLGNWPAGDSDHEGTRVWAGGHVNYSKGPFKMIVKSIKVINYSPGKEYQRTDKTGNSDSVKVIGAATNSTPIKASSAPDDSNSSDPDSDASKNPDADASTNPDADAHKARKARGAPGAQEGSKAPGVLDASCTPKAPDAPEASDVPDVSETPEAPEAAYEPEAANEPEASGAPNTSSAPDAPEADRKSVV